MKKKNNRLMLAALGVLAVWGNVASRAETTVMPEVTVYGDTEIKKFPEPVEGTAIYDGKKAEVIAVEDGPVIINSNYRQALARTPGLLVSEESSPLISLGYRGLPPHRAQYTQVLKDGIPIHADMFGYPEAYYTPPLDSVQAIEFIRGGGSLMYGPQPGGALNYVTKDPREDVPVAFETRQTFGSDNFYSTYNELSGTSDNLGYLGYVHYRESDGFREANSDYDVLSGSFKLKLQSSDDTRWTMNVDGYKDEHGEPGGLTLATGPNTVNYNENRNATSRFYDKMEIEREAVSVGVEHDVSPDTLVELKAWHTFYSRYTQRQRGGGFGTLPTGPDADSNTIELQEFNTSAIEGRVRHNWEAWDNEHNLVAGTMYYYVDSPRTDKRGAAADATDGKVLNKSDRTVDYAPVFVENRFVFDQLSVTPGFRLENIWQEVDEEVNDAKSKEGVALGSKDDHDTVPLFGIGAGWKLKPEVELYANASQSYRPKMFSETVPSGGTTVIPDDLDPSDIVQYDLGIRGNAAGYLLWDASVFLMTIDDQIGSISLDGGRSTLSNVGEAEHKGIEAAVELDVSGLIDDIQSSSVKEDVGSFILFGNTMLLDAEFTEGPLDGKTPQYAPDYLVRTGIRYELGDLVKVALGGTMVDDHFADDANRDERFIPSYVVWDLTGEVRVYRDFVSLFGGINNLLDEEYYARIRNEGIDPAAERNYYAGVKFEFY
jgi:Fe(3+) dicitrate transport protein